MDRQEMILKAIEEAKAAVNEKLDEALEKFMPRVLSIEEVLNWKDCVWVEEKNGDTYVALIRRIFEDRRLIAVEDCSHYYVSSGCKYEDYGRLKRFWTARPTKEQQEQTKWREKVSE